MINTIPLRSSVGSGFSTSFSSLSFRSSHRSSHDVGASLINCGYCVVVCSSTPYRTTEPQNLRQKVISLTENLRCHLRVILISCRQSIELYYYLVASKITSP